jgi:isoquinoline 1-oxidoreductase beta subunit
MSRPGSGHADPAPADAHSGSEERARGLSRRRLLQAAAGALVVPIPAWAAVPARPRAPDAPAAAFAPSPYIRIAADDTVTLVAHRSELGQGIRTTLAMILCDELDADWSRVRVERAQGDARFGDQDTVGDQSLLLGWTPLRTAAASARERLVLAASRRLAVPAASLRTEDGRVLAPDGRALRYGELAALAALEEAPAAPSLKPRERFRLIGTPRASVDLQAQTTGRLVYGLDVVRPGMRYAVIERAPLPRMRVASFDADAARRVRGVVDVFELPGVFAAEGATYAGVAVVGRDSWSCLQGRRALRVAWERADAQPLGSAEIRRRMEAAADAPGRVVRSGGDLDAARAASTTILKRRYWTPFLTHAPLEPPNCTADVRPDACEVWAPTQNPGEARERIAAELGVPVARVTVNVTDIGGAFGRKSMHDFVLEAVRVSRRAGAPVKVFWTREDDLRHGYYRSASLGELEAGIDARGRLAFWRHHAVQSSQRPTSEDVPEVDALGPFELAGASVERLPYAIPAVRFEGTHVATPLKRSWMRGIEDAFQAFAANCFLDEVAATMRRDPIELRLELLGPPRRLQFFKSSFSDEYWHDTGRMAGVMRRAAELAGWGAPRPAPAAADAEPGLRRGRGFATHTMSATYVALVAEVAVRPDGSFRVERVACAVDCGIVVNPDAARAQVEGAVVYAMSSCLFGEITLSDDDPAAGVVQRNFHDYPVARIGDMPQVDVAFVDSDRAPTGLGEPCVPLVAPAIANALADAGMARVTEWPIRKAEPARA